MFSALFIFSLFVGSSIAQTTDLQKLTSLQLVHGYVRSYVVSLYKVYSPNQFEPSYSLATLTNLGNTFPGTINKMMQNQASGSRSQPINVVDSADEITTQWTKEANDAINDIVDRFNNSTGQVKNTITAKTEEVINNINQDANIIPEYKGNWCPVFPTLSNIIQQFGNAQLRQSFEASYGLYETPRQQ